MQIHKLCLAALVSGAALLGQRQEAGAPIFYAQIDIARDAMAPGHRLLLRDIATVKTPDPRWTQALLDIEISRPPQPGFSRMLTRDEVIAKLVARGQKTAHLKVQGAERCYVLPHVAVVRSEELQKAGEKVLQGAILAQRDSDVQFELQQAPAHQKIPFGRTGRQLRPVLVGGKLGNNSAAVTVELLIDGKVYRSVRLNYRLSRYIQVLSLKRNVRRGERLDADLLGFQRVEALHGKLGYLTSLAEVTGKASATRLVAGTLLTDRHLMRPILIRRNDIVTLRLGSGRLRVSTQVMALQEGSVGDFIQVQHLPRPGRSTRRSKGRRLMHARIVDGGTVEIRAN